MSSRAVRSDDARAALALQNRDLALLVAIMNGHESVIKFLLGVGADVNHVQPVPAQNAINASANQLICAKYGVGERVRACLTTRRIDAI